MQSFIDSLIEQKYNRILEWRSTTDSEKYPIKLAKNLLYDSLTLLEMWGELKKSFRTFNIFGSNKMYEKFSDAHKYIVIRRRQIQTEIILPQLDDKYLTVKNLPYLNYESFRERCMKASDGPYSAIEEIEFTYFYHTGAYELIFGWSACGLMGMTKDEAFSAVCQVKIDGVDYNSIDSLIEAFGSILSMFYKPLPDYNIARL
ncbi:MAG TPA: hypothetical protein PLT92_14295 [Ignavibacteriaceae bacterium]|nr:hypothetical protein [Ignavibacteriaceae bacterium]